MENTNIQTIEVTVDKSHIVTIGERLYGESIELIRELINNAYDADAEEVKVSIKEDSIIVEDNGSGMDLEGLRQYFNIGSIFKRDNPKSPKFKRDRIGEFGIGKFASLSACSSFEIWTKKGDFQAKVVFDKTEWNKTKDSWHLPIKFEKPDGRLKDGTKIILYGLSKKFNITDVEKRIIESVPIKAPNFAVYLNGKKLSPRFIPGQRIPFMEGTEFGVIHGEIIITSSIDQNASESGIEYKVKGVTITKDYMGLEKFLDNPARIRGEVNADFLSVTSDRSGFIKDTPQYQKFLEVINLIMERAKPILERMYDYKENKRAKKTLKNILDKVRNALLLNPDYCPEGIIPIGDASTIGGQPGYVSQQKNISPDITGEQKGSTQTKRKKREKKPQIKRLTPTAVVKKLKSGGRGVSCCIDHFGPDSPECFTEGTVIYINRDHPLYQKEVSIRGSYELYMARLITQEICLMKEPRNPRQAFQIQSKLLKDALVEKNNIAKM